MDDYKEMVANLRMAGKWIKHDDGSEETYLLSVDDCVEIADAIEQLVKERDAAVKDLSHILHNLGYDASLYSESVCGYCKHHHEKDGECQQYDCYSAAENWEWRGVQE